MNISPTSQGYLTSFCKQFPKVLQFSTIVVQFAIPQKRKEGHKVLWQQICFFVVLVGAALNLIVREPGNILNAGNWKCFMHLGAIFTIPSSHPSSCTECINMVYTEYTHPQKPNQQKWYGHYWIGSCMSIQGTKSVLSELLAFAGTTMIGTANRHCVPEVLQDMTRNSCTYFWWLFVSWMKEFWRKWMKITHMTHVWHLVPYWVVPFLMARSRRAHWHAFQPIRIWIILI